MSGQDKEARLATPEYWDGIDIDDSSHFDVPHVRLARVTAQEQRAAGLVLASCLNEVMSNDFVEQDLATDGQFDPTETELGDGTVVVMDSENLGMWTYPAERDRVWQEQRPARDTSPIGDDFVGLWRSRQPHNFSADRHFGEESSVFIEDKMIYSRLLQWGVILTRRDKARERFLATWAFAAPAATPRGVSVPLSPDIELLRTAERLPMTMGRTVPKPDLLLPSYGIRSMQRVRKLKVVHAATAEYEPEKEKKRLFGLGGLKAAGHKEVLAPNPRVSTA